MTTQNSELITILSLLGLSENEARVYLATLEVGTGSVWDISKISGVKRPTCYLALEKLSSLGIAYRSSDIKKTVFSVVSPKELIASFEQRTRSAESKLSEFEAIASKAAYKPAVRLYEGIDGLQKVYDLSIDQADKEILIYGTAAVFDTFPDYFASFTERRNKKKVSIRFLGADLQRNRKLSESDSKVMRSTRFLPQEIYNPQQEVLVFGNFIAYIAVLDKQPFATLIESRLFADFEKQRFEIMWKIAKDK